MTTQRFTAIATAPGGHIHPLAHADSEAVRMHVQALANEYGGPVTCRAFPQQGPLGKPNYSARPWNLTKRPQTRS